MEPEHPLRAYRREKKVTLQSLADQLRVTKGFLSKIERRRQLPSFSLAERISAATDGALTPNDFLLPRNGLST